MTRIALMSGFAILVGARMPDLVMHGGRLWAEEGSVFYAGAAAMPWWQALFHTYAGYLNIAANATGIAVHASFPLEGAAAATSLIALALQCIPALLIVSAADRWLRPFVVRAFALLLIALPPLVEEVWIQTATAQFHLALACGLILSLDLPERRWPRLILLTLAPLCGPPAIAFLPLFILRASLDRSRERGIQAGAVALGTALQMALFYSTSGRPHGIGPVVLTCVVYIKQIVVPLFGRAVADHTSQTLQDMLAQGVVPWLACLATFGALVLLATGLIRRKLPAATWFFLGSSASALLAYYGAVDGSTHLMIVGNEGRYSFIPEVLDALSILGIATGARRPDFWIGRALVFWLVVVGAIDCLDPSPFMKQGADWRAEVAAWRADHSHPIAIWPQGWFLRLDQR